MNFSGKFGSDQTIWYPVSGFRDGSGGGLKYVGYTGYYWSASPYDNVAYSLYFGNHGNVTPSNYYDRLYGKSVRCLQE